MEILQIISALALVFGLLGALYWLTNRYSGKFGSNSNRKIRLVEKLPLGDKRSLILVEIGQQSYLVGSTPQNISMLAPLEKEESICDQETPDEIENQVESSGFRRVLELMK